MKKCIAFVEKLAVEGMLGDSTTCGMYGTAGEMLHGHPQGLASAWLL
jgi:hypothetical protein